MSEVGAKRERLVTDSSGLAFNFRCSRYRVAPPAQSTGSPTTHHDRTANRPRQTPAPPRRHHPTVDRRPTANPPPPSDGRSSTASTRAPSGSPAVAGRPRSGACRRSSSRRSGAGPARPAPTMLTSPLHDENRVVLVASRGGADHHPAWYVNLTANPDVKVTMYGKTRPMRARTASPEEKAALWPEIVAVYQPYEGYQQRSSRDIPVVICEPPPPSTPTHRLKRATAAPPTSTDPPARPLPDRPLRCAQCRWSRLGTLTARLRPQHGRLAARFQQHRPAHHAQAAGPAALRCAGQPHGRRAGRRPLPQERRDQVGQDRPRRRHPRGHRRQGRRCAATSATPRAASAFAASRSGWTSG